jgi:hypothetical protein
MLSSIAWKPKPTTTTRTSASPFGVASDAVVAAGCQPGPMPTLGGNGIALKLRRLHKGARIIELPDRPGEASCKKPSRCVTQSRATAATH